MKKILLLLLLFMSLLFWASCAKEGEVEFDVTPIITIIGDCDDVSTTNGVDLVIHIMSYKVNDDGTKQVLQSDVKDDVELDGSRYTLPAGTTLVEIKAFTIPSCWQCCFKCTEKDSYGYITFKDKDAVIDKDLEALTIQLEFDKCDCCA